MKRLAKQFLSLIMVLTLIVSGSSSVFAAAVNTDAMRQRQIQALTQEKERILDDIMEQLKAQGGESHYFIYENIVEQEYQAKTASIKGIQPFAAQKTYSAPNGAAVSYNQGGAQVGILYFNKSQTAELRKKLPNILASGSYLVLSQILSQKLTDVALQSLLNYVSWAVIFGTIDNMYRSNVGWTSIDNSSTKSAQQITSVFEMQTTSVLYAWSSAPTITVPSGVTSLVVELKR